MTVDNSAAEMHTTIYLDQRIAEGQERSSGSAPMTATCRSRATAERPGTTSSATFPDLPKNSWVSWVQASNFDAGTAYATFDRHTFGDMAPYVFKTTDYGKTWTPLVTPQDAKGVRGYAHVIKEDVVKPNLLFLGTEFGLWVSIDGGKIWAQFKGSHFPAVAVRDLAIQPRDNDLVLATHGRGIWIIDDITPWRALTPEVLTRKPRLFPRGRCSSGSKATAAGPTAPRRLSATIRPMPR